MKHTVDGLTSGEVRGWIAREEDNPVGFACIEPDGEISPLWVTPDARGTGIARSLFMTCLSHGATFARVEPGNETPLDALEAHGFKVSTQEPGLCRFELL